MSTENLKPSWLAALLAGAVGFVWIAEVRVHNCAKLEHIEIASYPSGSTVSSETNVASGPTAAWAGHRLEITGAAGRACSKIAGIWKIRLSRFRSGAFGVFALGLDRDPRRKLPGFFDLGLTVVRERVTAERGGFGNFDRCILKVGSTNVSAAATESELIDHVGRSEFGRKPLDR